MTAFEPELDIVIWAPAGSSASEVSRRARAIFDEAARLGLHLAIATMSAEIMGRWFAIDWDQPSVACLRSCLMKPEHDAWLDEILQRLVASADAARSTA